MDELLQKKLKRLGCQAINGNTVVCKNKTIKLKYVSKPELHPRYGCSFSDENRIEIRNDLPPDIERHVILHEVAHQLGHHSEQSANIKAFCIDPKGWIKTAGATLSDPERRKMYFE